MPDLSEIETLALDRRKIQAIKELRARTGLGLKEAKEAVEHFEAYRVWPQSVRASDDPESRSPPGHERLHAAEQWLARGKIVHAVKEVRSLMSWSLKDSKEAVDHYRDTGAWPQRLLLALEGGDATGSTAEGPPNDRARAELEELMARRQKIGAIKRLREHTGWGLRESKDAVDHYEARGVWSPAVLAVLGGSAPAQSAPAQSAPAQSAPAQSAPARPAPSADADAVLAALTEHLGHAPDLRHTAAARRAEQRGQLVMLGDRACFVRHDHGRAVVDLDIPYDQVSHAETHGGASTTLYVSFAHLHERLELGASDADAVLALFRVFAR